MMSERVIHNLVQGSPEWLAHRANYWNASDAPAMMGVSPYKTRSELLHEKATGLVKEVDNYTQALFDNGHRFEALARPLAEEIIGADLYPVSVTLGKLAVSLDGLTLGEDVNWEHKSLNDAIRAAQTAAELPIYLRVQMEQQFKVSGAAKTLFQASLWDAEGNLIEEKHLWYEPDLELQKQVVDGWIQFERDLAEYVPTAIPEKPKAEAIIALPALAVQIRGEVITSNLSAVQAVAEQYIANIKTDLKTDEDFVNAAENVTFCDDAEKRLAAALDGAIAQMSSVDEAKRTIEHLIAQFRSTRLDLNKKVEKRKAEIKENAVTERRAKWAEHVAALNKELAVVAIDVVMPDFVGAIKGLKTIASLYDKLDTALANGKIAADATAKDLRAKLDWHKQHAEHGFLFRDLQTLIQKPAEDFELAVTTRIAEHKRAEEEKAKAKPAEVIAETIPAQAPQSAPWIAPAALMPSPRATPTSAPTLRLGQINERLAPITLTAEGLATLGFKHSATDKAAKLYHESDFEPICAALVRHLEAALRKQAA
ncbi:YqaJ viral recombinase family protein [Paraburkholderia bryophila]|uniref:YqaJ viral recombinase family protein n=1 Tax=Paraburkholderia bryophila TaxID=420952 RepID=UPI00234A9DCD|nr:YqaJ viral recombinase family protein [Paraburkholderia bryophila]WCM21426.1 YqaJ viral recombinase family protein [Paraburkholderia bryophila]